MHTHQRKLEKLPDAGTCGLWEYILLANPDEKVSETVKEEKQRFYKDYQTGIAVNTEPHIAIANFLAKNVMEETLCRWIQRVCTYHQRFTVTLNNYSGFPTGVVYLCVQNRQPFKKLAESLEALDRFLGANECPPLQLASTPHMTIARKLPAPVYEKVIRVYAQRSFRASFQLQELVLLRRNSRYAKWKAVGRFPLSSDNNLFN